MRLINAARDDALYQRRKPWVIIVCNKNPDAPQDWGALSRTKQKAHQKTAALEQRTFATEILARRDAPVGSRRPEKMNALSAALSVWSGLLRLRRDFLQTRIVRR